MKRVLVPLLVGLLFMFPATSWSEPPFPHPMNIAAQVAALESQVAALQATVEDLQSQLTTERNGRIAGDRAAYESALANANAYTDSVMPDVDDLVPGLGKYVSVDTTNDRITFGKPGQGVNVQITNGEGGTDTINGKGNLIIGYDELSLVFVPFCSNGQYVTQATCEVAGNVWASNHKSGSHNLVIGGGHSYSQAGGFVAGKYNVINRTSSSVSGGYENRASGNYSSVSGGYQNIAGGYYSSVGSGYQNEASGNYSSVSGGYENEASGYYSSVGSGYENVASGEASSVNGGYNNVALGDYSSVSGGAGNRSTGDYSSVSGGAGNIAGGKWSTVSGGYELPTTSDYEHVP